MAEQTLIGDETQTMTRHQRYYALHRDEKLAKVKERYQNDPEFLAKKEEKERKRAEKEAEKEAKQIEKEQLRQEKLLLAKQTAKKPKNEVGGLDSVLGLDLSGKR
jgi:bisphosphoglycerate-independent phosphoglycerate mutase (AlkP superfamily)